MTKERGVIICLIIVVVMILMMLASSEKQLNEVRSKQFQYRALIEKNAKDIDELNVKLEQKQKVEKKAEELRSAEKGK